MKTNVRLHSSKDALWINAAGDQVPRKYLSKVDVVKESHAGKLHKAAKAAELALMELHKQMDEACKDVANMVRAEYEIKNGKKARETKGGLTWYNFDNSLKVECNVDEVVKWDDGMMAEARKLLDAYLDSQLTENQALIKKIVMAAFSNRKGTIDSRKVFELLSYENQISSSNYRKACEIMRQAQIIDRKKVYMKMSERMEDGSYRFINLNFSNI